MLAFIPFVVQTYSQVNPTFFCTVLLGVCVQSGPLLSMCTPALPAACVSLCVRVCVCVCVCVGGMWEGRRGCLKIACWVKTVRRHSS